MREIVNIVAKNFVYDEMRREKMTDEEFEQELHYYQQAIQDAQAQDAYARVKGYSLWEEVIPEAIARFQSLAEQDRPRFLQLCFTLLADTRREIRVGVMELIRQYRKRDTTLALALATIALKQKSVREEALFALWSTATRRVLPQLLVLADHGYSSALYIIRRMLQTPEEIEQGIAIARRYLGADEYYLREAALFLLQRYSTMEQEGERVLAAVQKYTDELFIDALRSAPPERVLEPLRKLRATKQVRTNQYEDLSNTIRVLEQKQVEADEQSKEG